jgi:hypothetical protein
MGWLGVVFQIKIVESRSSSKPAAVMASSN